MKTIAVFPRNSEFEKMKGRLDSSNLPYEILSPEPGYSFVGANAIIMEQDVRASLSSGNKIEFICSGWIDYNSSKMDVLRNDPPKYNDDVFGTASIMLIAPCIADANKIRLIAHISGDMGPAFPYLNTEMREGCYIKDCQTFNFMDSYRMVALYPRRISIAKADNIVDGWCTLEKIRCRVNDVWTRRNDIQPTDEMRRKPPALEIYKRLPGTNCGQCGQKTCMAFALTLWSGNTKPKQCSPVFEGEFILMKGAFLEICAGLGVIDGEFFSEA